MNIKHLIIYLIVTILLGAASLKLSGQNGVFLQPRALSRAVSLAPNPLANHLQTDQLKRT